MAVGGVGVKSVSGEDCVTKRTHPGCGERFLLGLVETPSNSFSEMLTWC